MTNTKDKQLQSMSLYTLTDLLKNPIEFMRAVNEFQIAKRFAN